MKKMKCILLGVSLFFLFSFSVEAELSNEEIMDRFVVYTAEAMENNTWNVTESNGRYTIRVLIGTNYDNEIVDDDYTFIDLFNKVDGGSKKKAYYSIYACNPGYNECNLNYDADSASTSIRAQFQIQDKDTNGRVYAVAENVTKEVLEGFQKGNNYYFSEAFGPWTSRASDEGSIDGSTIKKLIKIQAASGNSGGQSLTCVYNMGDGNSDIIITVDEDQNVSAREDPEFYPVNTSFLVYERFLASNKKTLKCPSKIYRAIGSFGTSYDVCSDKERCRELDFNFIMGELRSDESSSDVDISEDTYMSCEYRSNGAIVGSDSARILYTVKNDLVKFSIQYGNYTDVRNIILKPTDGFQIANSCEEQGSLWIDRLQTNERSIHSSKDSTHSLELTLVSEDEREILDQDETDKKNGQDDTKPGFTPKKLCEDGNCDISLDGFCEIATVSRTLKFIGILVYVLKILVPGIIILMGTRNLFQIVTSGKTEDAKKYVVGILKRIVMGIIIFLLPGLLSFVYDLANNIIGTSKDNKANNCVNCVLDPFDQDKCKIKESD